MANSKDLSTMFYSPDGGDQYTLKMKVSWDSSLNVTVKFVSCSISNFRWRIKIRGMSGDNGVQVTKDGKTDGSFKATSGTDYILQACHVNGGWNNSGFDAAGFTAVYDSSSGSGSGGSETTTCKLSIFSENANVDVSDIDGNTLSHNDTLEVGDYIALKYAAIDGYSVYSFSIYGADRKENYDQDGYEVYKVTGDVSIFVAAEPMGRVYIDNGTKLEAYQIFIDNGSKWEQYIPYIDNGSGWGMCN